MNNPWKRHSSREVYKNKWIRVREDIVTKPDGSKGIYGVIELKPSVFIVPLDSNNETYLIHQFRYPTGSWSWEIPGGSSDGEKLLSAAKRELQEETGLVANDWVKVGEFQSLNGIADEIGHVYLARELTQTTLNKRKEEGVGKVKKFAFEIVLEMIRSGKITDCQTIAAIEQVNLFLNS